MVVPGDAAICRDASGAPPGTFVSFIGVNIAVNAISLLARGAVNGAGVGNCGVPETVACGPAGAGEDWATWGAAGGADVGIGATIAVSIGISATFRTCFRASAAGRAAVGTAEEAVDPDKRLLNIDRIVESAICSDDAGAKGVRASAATGSPTAGAELSEGAVDPDDRLPSIDRIIESATCAGDAVVTGVFAAVANGDVA